MNDVSHTDNRVSKCPRPPPPEGGPDVPLPGTGHRQDKLLPGRSAASALVAGELSGGGGRL